MGASLSRRCPSVKDTLSGIGFSGKATYRPPNPRRSRPLCQAGERPGAAPVPGPTMPSICPTLCVSHHFHRLDTSRAMAKTLFTLLKSVIPRSLECPMTESLAHLARFAKGEVAAPDPILFRRLSRKPVRRHHLRVEFGPKGFCFEVVLYNALAWRMQGRALPQTVSQSRCPCLSGKRWMMPPFQTWLFVRSRIRGSVCHYQCIEFSKGDVLNIQKRHPLNSPCYDPFPRRAVTFSIIQKQKVIRFDRAQKRARSMARSVNTSLMP